MTTEKLCSALRFYACWTSEVKNCLPVERPDDPCHFEHLAWMCDRAEFDFVPAGGDEINKAHRRLGYVQGVLVAKGLLTLVDVRGHSRSRLPLP